MLSISNLSVSVDGKNVLDKITMDFDIGKNYFIIGTNGSGKTSIAMTLIGYPKYKIESGEIKIDGKKINNLKTEERSLLGLFGSFQNIPEIPGIKLFEFLRIIYNNKFNENLSFVQFKKKIFEISEKINFNNDLLWRDLNVGCSGGEKRKIEMLQILLLRPKYVILDEIDSGVDQIAQNSIQIMIEYMQKEFNTTFIIISHNPNIFQKINIFKSWEIEKGKIIKKG